MRDNLKNYALVPRRRVNFYCLFVKHKGQWNVDCQSWNKSDIEPDYHVAKRIFRRAKIVTFDDDSPEMIRLALSYHNECL